MGADTIIVSMLFMVFGIVLGYGIGSELGKRAQTNKQYWLYNLAVVLGGILVSAIVSVFQLISLASLAIGVIGGGIAGLKFGFGKSVGVWQKHDRAFRVNADHLKATESAREAQQRGESEQQAAERDLISVGKQQQSPYDKSADPDAPAIPQTPRRKGGRKNNRSSR